MQLLVANKSQTFGFNQAISSVEEIIGFNPMSPVVGGIIITSKRILSPCYTSSAASTLGLHPGLVHPEPEDEIRSFKVSHNVAKAAYGLCELHTVQLTDIQQNPLHHDG